MTATKMGRLFLAAALLVLALASCAPAAAPVNPAALVVAVPEGPAQLAAEAAAGAYTQATGEPVRVEAVPANQYARRTGEVLMAGLADYDLIYLPAESLPKWAGYHALRPWAAALPAGVAPEILALITFDGQVYGLPAEADPLLLWYRADLLANGQSSPAESWEAFRAYAEAAAQSEPRRYGYFPAAAPRDAALDIAAFLYGFGAPSALALDDPSARAGLDFYNALRAQPGLSPPVADSARLDAARLAETGSRGAVIAALREGEAAMGFAPRSAAAALSDCDKRSPACDDGQSRLASANPPGGCALLAELWVWGAPLRSTRPEAAERFAAWLMREDGARAWKAGGGAPLLLEADACFQSVFPPAAEPDPLWLALGGLALPGASQPAGSLLAETAQTLRAEMRRQGIADPPAP